VKVLRSTTMGYCSGVSRVIEMANECLLTAKEQQVPAYSIGWFIHNPTVVTRFQQAGMHSINEPQGQEPGIALIRAHGIADSLRQDFEQAGFTLIDGTCPTVAYSQKMIRTADRESVVIIIGQKGHSEVIALQGVWDEQKKPIPVTVVQTAQEVAALEDFVGKQILLMVQTTFEQMLYEELKKAMIERYKDNLVIGNKLCPTTQRRHKAVHQLCDTVEAVVVVGGKMSANTTALKTLVQSRGLPVWHIENASELPSKIFAFASVGVTAGASTPAEDIDEVVAALSS